MIRLEMEELPLPHSLAPDVFAATPLGIAAEGSRMDGSLGFDIRIQSLLLERRDVPLRRRVFRRPSNSSEAISHTPNEVIGFRSPRRIIVRSVLAGIPVSAETSRSR